MSNRSHIIRTYPDIAARDADSAFQIQSNLNKTVRINSPLGFQVLAAVGPATWNAHGVFGAAVDFAYTPDGKLGIGTSTPNARMDVTGLPGASVGGFPSGQLHVTSPATGVNANSVITGHSSFNGNTQLWYLGSTSGSNQNIGFINRQGGVLALTTPTANLNLNIDGTVGIGNLRLIGSSLKSAANDVLVEPASGGKFTFSEKGITLEEATAPTVGILNSALIYAKNVVSTVKMHVMDEANNETLISPHDEETNEWIFLSRNVKTGRKIQVDMERFFKDFDERFNTDYYHETH